MGGLGPTNDRRGRGLLFSPGEREDGTARPGTEGYRAVLLGVAARWGGRGAMRVAPVVWTPAPWGLRPGGTAGLCRPVAPVLDRTHSKRRPDRAPILPQTAGRDEAQRPGAAAVPAHQGLVGLDLGAGERVIGHDRAQGQLAAAARAFPAVEGG